MIFAHSLLLLVVAIYNASGKTSSNTSIPLSEIERRQNEILKNLTNEREMTKDLESKINEFNPRQSNPSKMGIDVNNDTVFPQTNNVSKLTEEVSKYNYTPPVIVLLPEDTTEMDIWEYKVAKSCLKEGFKAAYEGDNLAMVEMAEDSAATVDELREHIEKIEKQIDEYLQKSEEMESELKRLKRGDQNEKNKKEILYLEKRISRVSKHLNSLDSRKEKLKNRLKAAILFRQEE